MTIQDQIAAVLGDLGIHGNVTVDRFEGKAVITVTDDDSAYREILDALAAAEAALYYIADFKGQRLTNHLVARANVTARRAGRAFATLRKMVESDFESN